MQVVITEAELKRFTGVDELLIPDDAVVTPTAWDYARTHRIRLVRSENLTRSIQSSLPSEPAYSVHPVYSAQIESTSGQKVSLSRYAC